MPRLPLMEHEQWEKHNSILDQSSQKTNQINENVNEIEESILNNNNKRAIYLQWSIEIFPLECKWFNSFLFNQYRQQQQTKKNNREGISLFLLYRMCIHLWNLIDPYWIEISFYKSMGRDTIDRHTLWENSHGMNWFFFFFIWIIIDGKLNGGNNGKKL